MLAHVTFAQIAREILDQRYAYHSGFSSTLGFPAHELSSEALAAYTALGVPVHEGDTLYAVCGGADARAVKQAKLYFESVAGFSVDEGVLCLNSSRVALYRDLRKVSICRGEVIFCFRTREDLLSNATLKKADTFGEAYFYLQPGLVVQSAAGISTPKQWKAVYQKGKALRERDRSHPIEL